MGDSYGRLWTVFDPPWWKLWRWLWWWGLWLWKWPRRERVTLTLHFANGHREVRAARSTVKLSTVPEHVEDQQRILEWARHENQK